MGSTYRHNLPSLPFTPPAHVQGQKGESVRAFRLRHMRCCCFLPVCVAVVGCGDRRNEREGWSLHLSELIFGLIYIVPYLCYLKKRVLTTKSPLQLVHNIAKFLFDKVLALCVLLLQHNITGLSDMLKQHKQQGTSEHNCYV